MKVAYSRQGGDEIKGANLYVTNVPKHWKVEQLQAAFVSIIVSPFHDHGHFPTLWNFAIHTTRSCLCLFFQIKQHKTNSFRKSSSFTSSSAVFTSTSSNVWTIPTWTNAQYG
jgi:hypothetical protein